MEVFNNLGFREKCDILRRYAQFITSITYYHYTVKLYTWDRFFIEEYFDNETEEITRISIAEDVDMEKYLDLISLCDLAYLPGFE
ncbi:MAG TPA: hypothetical protein VEB86_05605 [Chryseosolibacter sp.]|nr:hypothetical protein [Chryseosolibacter sp.]